jgi:predicted transcriptional regulator
MTKSGNLVDLEEQVLYLLAAHPGGLPSPAIRKLLKPSISQPTLSRLLTRLRARGAVMKTDAARATRYHLVGGRVGAAELRSRLLHEQVAKRLVHDPALKSVALKRLEKIRRANPSGRPYHRRWAELLESDMPRLLRVMTEDSERGAALRRESPFTVLYDPALRKRLLKGHSVQNSR